MSRIFCAAGLILGAQSLLAGVPQPMCVYYGQALNGYGWPYQTNAQVVLVHGTDEIAQHIIAGSISPGVNFALYAHLDDGLTTNKYSPRALHSGDLVSIVVRDQFGEKTIMEQQAVPPIGEPGELIMINVTAATDADGDKLPDLWEEELVFWSNGLLHDIFDVHPEDDFDGDGQSNGDEYGTGTFAFLDYDYFFAEDYGFTPNGRFRITFLSVPGKVYGARYVTDMKLSKWSAAPLAASDPAPFQTDPIEGTGDWLSLYLPGDLGNSFFRPTVETSFSYQLTATNVVASNVAQDVAENAPYPATQFQTGDNGGSNFEPWMHLEGDGVSGYKSLAPSIGESQYAWALTGSYAMGRGLKGIAHHGFWQIHMMHGTNNTGFSGFNLKMAALADFAECELIRVGLPADLPGFQTSGIYVSINGGKTYEFKECGWTDGRGDQIIYQFWWDESGAYTLTVVNVSEDNNHKFHGVLPSTAVCMLGVGVFGSLASDSVQFDGLQFQSAPALTMQRSGSDLILSWPTGFDGFGLQSNLDLNQPDGWTPITATITEQSGVDSVVVPMTSRQQFFRLAR